MNRRNPEPPEPEEPPRCRHCGEELPDDQHQELGGCPSQPETWFDPPEAPPEEAGDDMIIPERDQS